MAVSLFNSGTVGTATSGTSLDSTLNCSGTDRAILLIAQFTSASTPTGVTATWDPTGANQSMTLIRTWHPATTGFYFYMYGLVNPTAGTSKVARIAWTGSPSGILAHGSAWQGVLQTSVAAAFTNGIDDTQTNNPAITVTSQTGDMVVAVFEQATANVTTINDTTLFSPTFWNGGVTRSFAAYAIGAGSVTIDATLSSPPAWFGQGINIVQSAGVQVDAGTALFAGAGGFTANSIQRQLTNARFDAAGQVVAAANVPGSSETAAWKAAVQGLGGNVSGGREALVDTLIAGLKADGIWAKLDRLWLYAAENTESARVDLKTANTAMSLVGAPAFLANHGYTFNGTTNYIDTGFNPATAGGVYTKDSAHMSAWPTNIGAASWAQFGNYAGQGTELAWGGNRWFAYINDNSQADTSITTGNGLMVLTRTGPSARALYTNGTSAWTDATTASTAVANANLYVGAVNAGGAAHINTGEIAAVSIGAGLNPTENANFYSRLNAYITSAATGVSTLSASALLAATGGLSAIAIGGAARHQGSALLSAVVALPDVFANVRSLTQNAAALLSPSGELSAFANTQRYVQIAAALRAAASLALSDDHLSIEKSPVPSARHSSPMYEGDNASNMVMITSHLNDAHVLEIGGGGVIAGRGLPGYGPMQAVTLYPPLYMNTDGRILIDIDQLSGELGSRPEASPGNIAGFAVDLNILADRIAVLESRIAALENLTTDPDSFLNVGHYADAASMPTPPDAPPGITVLAYDNGGNKLKVWDPTSGTWKNA